MSRVEWYSVFETCRDVRRSDSKNFLRKVVVVDDSFHSQELLHGFQVWRVIISHPRIAFLYGSFKGRLIAI